MKKIALIAIVMFSYCVLQAQVKPKVKTQVDKLTPTKQETIQWIVDKIRNNTKSTGAWNYRFVGFDKVNSILVLNVEYNSTSGTTHTNYDLHLDFNKITYFSYMEAAGPNFSCATYPGHPDIAPVCENNFRFQDCVDKNGEDNLYDRLGKAFNVLIKYNKDEKKKDNETF